MRQSASLERPLDDGAEIADVDNFFDTTEIGALEALQCLDETERQIIVMKLDCGMKHRHIASILGISEAACQKRYRRSLEKLKDYYAREKRR